MSEIKNQCGEGILYTIISLSNQIYDLDTIKKTAYRFSAEGSFAFNPNGDEIACQVTFLAPMTEADVQSFRSRFDMELLDQDLRQRVAGETTSMRNAILGYAFSRTGLQGE